MSENYVTSTRIELHYIPMLFWRRRVRKLCPTFGKEARRFTWLRHKKRRRHNLVRQNWREILYSQSHDLQLKRSFSLFFLTRPLFLLCSLHNKIRKMCDDARSERARGLCVSTAAEQTKQVRLSALLTLTFRTSKMIAKMIL